MIDTHCHLTFDDFEGRIGEVLTDAATAGVSRIITVSTTPADAEASLAVARQFRDVFCTAGVHPLYADQTPPGASTHDWDALVRVAGADECVAWGELGLDGYYDKPAFAEQRRVLDEQLQTIARSGIDKPIVLHCREAFDELIPVLRESGMPGERFVFHCFTAGPREMELVLDFGAWVSFTGVLTYPNAQEVRDAAKLVPMDRVMVETDAPFLTPAPHRGKRPNEPKYVVHTAAALAELKELDAAEMERVLDANAERFFGVKAVNDGG
jgi:TatD DNase family protein